LKRISSLRSLRLCGAIIKVKNQIGPASARVVEFQRIGVDFHGQLSPANGPGNLRLRSNYLRSRMLRLGAR
jgi:hypothetical protein